jgi:hypothetical protein
MSARGRSQFALGIILILLGAGLLLGRSLPDFYAILAKSTEFPANMLFIGCGIFIFALVLHRPSLCMPAAIVAGLGAIFYYQKATGIDGSWSYLWTLILGLIGVGNILSGLLGDSTAYNIRRGRNWLVLSVVLFLVFSSFFGSWEFLGTYGPAILLILMGVWVLVGAQYRSFMNRFMNQ